MTNTLGNRVELQTITKEKDIGVTIDDNLNFDYHINNIVKKANSLMGIIRRAFTTLDCETFPLLFKALVRPHLEYAESVWNPYLKRQIKLIEDVQRRATKWLPGMKDLAYTDRLAKLKLPTLIYRRHRGDMIEAYKILNNKYDSQLPKFLQIYNCNYNTRGHQLKLVHQTYKTKVRENFFSNRIVNMWNDLPEDIVVSKTVDHFEKLLDKFWINQEFKFDWTAEYNPNLNNHNNLNKHNNNVPSRTSS